MTKIKVGINVFHPHYGDGKVVKIYPKGYGETGKPEADVAFMMGIVTVSVSRLTVI